MLATMNSEAAEQRGETEAERVDRNLEELMAEMRLAVPGAQVLFAFLLILPFNSRFTEVNDFERGVFFGTLILTALATVLLIAPSQHHRMHFRQGVEAKERTALAAHRLVLVGLGMLALAVVGAVLLVSNFVYGSPESVIAAGAVGLVAGVAWYGSPLRRRLR